MSFSVVAKYLLIIFITLVNGMPQKEDTAQEKAESLPFLQFTNGGIRVNFAGYHAEAGLGGLLRGGLGGGLHASAGTPWGAHAGAGLGGQVGDNLGGGLYARAGLGRGAPEAAAGLGGRVDGSGRSANPISGGLYAGATPGGGLGRGVFLGGGADQPFGYDGTISGSAAKENNLSPPAAVPASADAAANVTKPTKGRTNIQIIRSRAQKEKEIAVAADATLQAVPASEKTQNTETRRAVPYTVVAPAAEVGLVKSVYVGAAPAVKTVVVPAPAVAVPVQVTGTATSTATGGIATGTITGTATVADNPSVVVPKPVYPRWHFRKRFWTAPRKAVYVAPTMVDSQSSPSDIVGGIYVNAMGDSGMVAAAGKTYVSGSLIDDIFNIPISTLSAVNQLLRNNIGGSFAVTKTITSQQK